MLRQSGFTTGAVDNLYQLKEWFARGFRYYINSVGNRRWIDGATINELAKPWLREHKDEDFFSIPSLLGSSYSILTSKRICEKFL